MCFVYETDPWSSGVVIEIRNDMAFKKMVR